MRARLTLWHEETGGHKPQEPVLRQPDKHRDGRREVEVTNWGRPAQHLEQSGA